MASSSSTPAQKYQVFLSFRGEDTRNTFVGHLYTALVHRGIVTYKDDHNLEKGQSISPELMKAIEESQFAIIVFSKNYASSTWCLEELAKIMKCEADHGQTVIPIFYDVDPSDVRKQKNSFAESFVKHEENFKDSMEKVQIWKENLFKAGGLTGVDIRGKDEASCIKNIVEEIFSKLLPEPCIKDLVGMESRMRGLSSLLFKEPNAVRFVGIVGMGGIGKTTLARAIFYNLIRKFETGCFLQDVGMKRDMVDLQQILLCEVLKLESVCVSDEYRGSRMIEDALRFKKVLLVLDGINNLRQVKSLAGESSWFGPGSRIIITTRDKHLLNKVDDIYEAQLLSESDAMQLFCWHAFEQSHPDEDFGDLSDRVVSYAHGLPLALKVLGSHLCGQGIDVWESAFDRLKDAPEDAIFTSLEISFKGLSNIHQNTFLDIACFYRGWEEDDVKKRLHSRGFHPVESITVLIQRSLLHILSGRIQMHDLIQEMGQFIVRQKADMEPRRYSRLWTCKDICEVLIDDTGNAEVEALVLSYDETKNEIENILSLGSFKRMKKLKLLDILGPFGPDYLPNTLRWLSWPHHPGKYLPEYFRPINLVHLVLKYSSIVEIPDVSVMPNLEVLDLFGCGKLLEVHPSIRVHKKLVHLNLRCCFRLEKFQGIICMESLEILDLSGCLKFDSFPEIHVDTSRLRTLNLMETKIEELPWSVGGLTSLRELNLSKCEELKSLPSSLFGLQRLEFIDLGGCKKLKYLFEKPNISEVEPNISEVVHCYSESSSLKRKREEYLTATDSLSSPESINRLSRLQVLGLKGCEMLAALPELPSNIKELDLSYCRALRRIESFNRLSPLQKLNLRHCEMLEALPDLPSSIKKLDLYGCRALTRIPSLIDLLDNYEDLHHLTLNGCEQLFQIPDPPDEIEDLHDTPQQNIPKFLQAFWVWRSASKVLCTRHELLELYLPLIEIPDWLYQTSWNQVRVALSPSWYNDKLTGFALCANNVSAFFFQLYTSNGLVSEGNCFASGGTSLWYIPISTITSDPVQWKDQNDCFLFEVTDSGLDHTSWGIRLVYEGEVDHEDIISHLTFIEDYDPTDEAERPRLKVCIAPRNES